ncbi:anthranilate synthase component I [Amphibacillus sediminis]|uniref:anthranilate synthase component I n=1 Tax=Amphibacillus sediminis TaxID=360185 RepID=UPI00083796C5|nr:anthranilate synthase component I [Amphibacillus sediminis]
MTYPFQLHQLNADTLTPITVFNRLQGQNKFILESSSGHGEKGRYSFIGINPFKEIRAVSQQVEIKHAGTVELITAKPLEIVKQHIPQIDLDLPFPFYGGAIGYIGYDCIRDYEAIGTMLTDEINMPDLHLLFYQDLVIFDHKQQTLSLVAIDFTGERSIEQLQSSVKELAEQISTPQPEQTQEKFNLSFQPALDQETFVNMVKTAKQHIIDGDIFQVVLSQRMKARFTVDPFTFYRRLRLANPSPYMFYIDFGSSVVLGASPESLIKTKGKTVVTNPIAGTRPRGQTEEQDQALADELLADEKERAEHKMLVDLSRNDLGRVCQVNSVNVSKYMMIERYQHVMHIVSEVTGELADPYTGLDALIATLPAGTVSGAPKIRAMQIINDLEKDKRGVYAGSVGYININGDIDLALAIRTMVIKEKTAYVQAGAGIVYDSDPISEYQETLNKAKALLEVTNHDFIN